MIYHLRMRGEVAGDLKQASNWYDERKAGLGADFLRECKFALDRVVKHPEHAASNPVGIRSNRIHRFPYVVHYWIEDNTVVVFAIMFGGRDDSAWQNRL